MDFNETKFVNACKKFDSIYIYGAGQNAKKLYNILQMLGIGVSGFYVTSMKQNKEYLQHLPVMPIEAFNNDEKSLIIISISAETEPAYSQIIKKLQELGISNFYSLSQAFYFYFENKDQDLAWHNEDLPAAPIQGTSSPKVTLILPSLNSAKYISETLDSVCAQTLHDIEILCIDAGSTDGTKDIIRRYAEKDKRIRLIEFPVKSYGAQMNFGIKEARGEFVGIVETDDFIAPEMCEELYTHAVKHNADFVKADFDLFTDRFPEGRVFLKSQIQRLTLNDSWCYSNKDYLKSIIPVDVFIWAGIYRRSWLLENNIVFQETPGAAYQDYAVRHQIAFAVNRGFILNKSFYRYRRDNSASSMWSGKSALYNYNETAFLVRLARERQWPKKYLAFLTRYFVINALYPTIDTLLFSEPDKSMKESIEKFRTLFQELLDEGALSQANTGAGWGEDYLLAKMLIENPDSLFQYMFRREQLRQEPLRQLLDFLAPKEEIVLCESESFSGRIYSTLRANGINTISAISNYTLPPTHSTYLGLPVDFPEKIVPRFPNAHYVVAGIQRFTEPFLQRLLALGVDETNITEFNMWIDPFRCFQPVLRSADDYRRVFEKAREINLLN